MNILHEDEDGGENSSLPSASEGLPFIRNPHQPPFDRSDARADDIRLAAEACAAMGCDSITSGQSRKWAEIERRRIQYATYNARAKEKRLKAKSKKP